MIDFVKNRFSQKNWSPDKNHYWFLFRELWIRTTLRIGAL